MSEAIKRGARVSEKELEEDGWKKTDDHGAIAVYDNPVRKKRLFFSFWTNKVTAILTI